MSAPADVEDGERERAGFAHSVRMRIRRAALGAIPPAVEYRRWLRRHERALFPEAPPCPRRVVVIVPAAPGEESRAALTRRSLGSRGSDVRSVLRGDPLPRVHDADAVLVLEPGDVLRAGALERLAAVLPDEGLAYADEDIGTRGGPASPRLKPAWSPTLAARCPEILPGSPSLLAPTLWNRALETADARSPRNVVAHAARLAKEAVHIPSPLLSRDGEAAMRDLEAIDSAAESVSSHSRAAPRPSSTLVSIVVPTHDRPDLLETLLGAIDRHDPGAPFELIFVDHASTNPRVGRVLADAQRKFGGRALPWTGPFNFSAMSNAGARAGSGETLLFMNDDVEPRFAGWLAALVGALSDDVGAAGPLLLYPDGRVQHAGIALGIGTIAGHLHKGRSPAERSPFPGPLFAREVSALTAACLCMRRDTFEALGGFDEVDLPVSFNDVDLCLRMRAAGRSLVYVPDAALVHRETATRTRRLDPREIAVMERRWGKALAADPYLHPGLSRLTEAPHFELWETFSAAPRSWPRTLA